MQQCGRWIWRIWDKSQVRVNMIKIHHMNFSKNIHFILKKVNLEDKWHDRAGLPTSWYPGSRESEGTEKKQDLICDIILKDMPPLDHIFQSDPPSSTTAIKLWTHSWANSWMRLELSGTHQFSKPDLWTLHWWPSLQHMSLGERFLHRLQSRSNWDSKPVCSVIFLGTRYDCRKKHNWKPRKIKMFHFYESWSVRFYEASGWVWGVIRLINCNLLYSCDHTSLIW